MVGCNRLIAAYMRPHCRIHSFVFESKAITLVNCAKTTRHDTMFGTYTMCECVCTLVLVLAYARLGTCVRFPIITVRPLCVCYFAVSVCRLACVCVRACTCMFGELSCSNFKQQFHVNRLSYTHTHTLAKNRLQFWLVAYRFGISCAAIVVVIFSYFSVGRWISNTLTHVDARTHVNITAKQ